MTVDIKNFRPTGWSKSSVSKVLEGCSWQYLLVKSGTVADQSSPQALLGITYHACIERRERARISRRRGVAVDIPTEGELYDWGVGQLTAGWPDLSEAEQDKYSGGGLDGLIRGLAAALLHWHNVFAPIVDGWAPATREPLVTAHTPGGIQTRGYIDGVYWDPDAAEWVIVDDKSTASWGRWPEGGEGHELEGAMYTTMAARSQVLPFDVARMEWHLVRTSVGTRSNFIRTRRIQRSFTEPKWAEFADSEVAHAQHLVDTRAHQTNTSWNLCSRKWCPAYDPCQGTGELAPGNVNIVEP